VSGKHVWRRIVGIGHHPSQEELGGFAIARLRPVEIHGLAVAVHRAEQGHLFTGDANERLVHVPRRGFPLHFTADPPQHFWTVPLGPTPDRHMVDGQASLRHKLFQIAQAQAEAQVSADAGHDQVRLELSLPEQRWTAATHGATLANSQLQHFPILRSSP
jgi:hypothetical protein